jgi:hypothetical protein
MGSRHFVRYALGTLLAFMALCAFGGGIYGMLGAEEVPVEWLAGSPFSDYFFPSLILFFAVGGTAAVGSVFVFLRMRRARDAAILSGVVQLGWIGVQVAMIGYVSWLQPTVAVYAFLTLALAALHPND